MNRNKKDTSPDVCTIERAVKSLNNNEIIAFPTETTFGLGVDPFSTIALEKLFFLKKRERNKPILILISNREQLNLVTEEIPEVYLPLMEKFWPGPLTLVFKARKKLPQLLTGGLNTIGVRISPHPVVRNLLDSYGKPITATSANISSNPPATTVKDVMESFKNEIPCVLDGVTSMFNHCSTIVGCKDDEILMFREGAVKHYEISKVFGIKKNIQSNK